MKTFQINLGVYVEILIYVLVILATPKVISGRVPTFNSPHTWWLYSAAPLGNQTTNTVTWYPIQSNYPDTESTSPCHIQIMPSAWLGSDRYHFYKPLVWLNQGFGFPDLWKRETDALLIRPSRLVLQ